MTVERLDKRFEVHDGFVTLALRKPLRLGWAKPGELMQISNMSLRGIQILGHGTPPREGSKLRIAIYADKVPTFHVTARVKRIEPIEPAADGQGGISGWGCACEFTAYDKHSWARLRILEARMRKLTARMRRRERAAAVPVAASA